LTKGAINAVEQGTTALVNILLLSACDELIGTFSSSFFKVRTVRRRFVIELADEKWA
jgi:hypothetical protein